MVALFRSDGWVKSAIGPAVPGALVYVCLQPANVVPPVPIKNGPITGSFVPSPLASIFADPFGLVPIAQPIITDGFGHYDFYAAPNLYTVVVSNAGTIQQVYPDQSVGGFGTGNVTGNTTGLIAGSNITIIGNVISAVIPPPPSGGGVTGSGTIGTIPKWTGTSVLGDSLLTDNGSTLSYGSITIIGGTIGATGSTPLVLTTADSSTTNAADIDITPGASTHVGTGNKGGSVVLSPGQGNPANITNNGRVSVGRTQCATYFSSIAFSQLAVPKGNPTSTSGALVYCSDAKNASDGATWGSTAAGSGSGAVLRYNGSNWVVVG